MHAHAPQPPSFGPLLRQWRLTRRLSQQALSDKAQVSARHLSFLETGRAQPSRDMVRLLGVALQLPLADQNLLHASAGFVPPFAHSRLDDAVGDPAVRQALELVLAQQEPFPALVIDGRWDVRMSNRAAPRFFGPLGTSIHMPPDLRKNAIHVVFHPGGMRPFISNWEAFAGHLIQVLHREVAQGAPGAAALRDEILRYPGLPPSWSHAQARTQPLTPMDLVHGTHRASFFTTLTTFAMPCDVALQQLKIESFFPADAATAQLARQLAHEST